MEYPKEYPKLKFPENQTLERAQRARFDKKDKSFAATVYAAMREGEKKANEWIGDFKASYYNPSYNNESLATKLNNSYSYVRSRVSSAARDYLLKHDGVIDVWPDAMGEGVHQFNYKDQDTGKVIPVGTTVFEYFGADYVSKLTGVRRKSKGFVYQNGYENKHSGVDGYYAATRKRDELKKEMEETEKRTNALAQLGLLLGIPYLAFATVCILASMFFGFGDVVMGLFGSLEGMPTNSGKRSALHILYTILFLPVILYSWIATLTGKLYWILTILLLILCAGGFVICIIGYREFRAEWVKAKRARKAYQEYVGSEEYKRIIQENQETLAKDMAFAEEWQRAWYNWICSVRKAPYTSKELDEKLAEQKGRS